MFTWIQHEGFPHSSLGRREGQEEDWERAKGGGEAWEMQVKNQWDELSSW